MNESVMIKIEHLFKTYEDFSVLEDVSTEIHKGDVVSIIGPSGCGKSTFMRCLNLLEQPTGGKILIEGEDILDKKADVNKLRLKMGMVFQSFNLFSHLMIIENIMLGPTNLLKKSRQEAYDEGMELLEMVGLSHKAMNYPDELSGGQKQRVAIARTPAMHPDIVLFDEPTSALDPTMVSEVLAVIRKLASQGMTMMIVTHEMNFAKNVSNRVFYMDEKGIYEQGTPQQIFENPQKQKTQEFIYKIRTFQYQITDKKFDLYAFQAELENFLKNQLFSEKRINQVLLVCEELIYHCIFKSFGERFAPVDITVQYSEQKDETVLTYSGELLTEQMIQNADDMAMSIVKREGKDIRTEKKQLIVTM